MRTTYEIVKSKYDPHGRMNILMWVVKYADESLGRAFIDEYNWLHDIPELQSKFIRSPFDNAVRMPVLGTLLCTTFNWSLSRYGYEYWERAFDRLPDYEKRDDSNHTTYRERIAVRRAERESIRESVRTKK